MPARLYVYDTVFKRLAQDLEDMTAEHGPLIQEEDAVVGQRHVAQHRHLAPTDQAHLQDGVVGGAKGARPHQSCTGAVRPVARWMCVVARASASVQDDGRAAGAAPPWHPRAIRDQSSLR
jgi:hypothetical protein